MKNEIYKIYFLFFTEKSPFIPVYVIIPPSQFHIFAKQNKIDNFFKKYFAVSEKMS